MEFRILGPLEVETDGTLIALGPTKQRALLAVLLLRSNRVVSRDELVDALWGERAPETAATAVHGYVSGLRKALGKERIATRSGGYVLRMEPEELDLGRFESLAGQARALEPRAAADCLGAALALWRGRPFSDVDGAPFLEAERRRLEELRLGTLEDRIDADLVLGRHADVVAGLDALVHEHPLRERLCGQLMLALYRSGRQAEALEVYQRHRRDLSSELGLEPGEALRRLERAILEQDPSLAPVAPTAPPHEVLAASAEAVTVRSSPLSRWRVAIVGAAVLALAAVAATVAALVPGGDSHGPAVRPNSVAVIDPKTNELAGDVPVGTRPVAIAVGEGGVWVANEVDRTVSRIDPKTRKVGAVIGVGNAHDLAVGFGSVWVAGGTDGTVTRIDAKNTDRTPKRLTLGGGRSPPPVFWVAVGAGAVWATSGQTLVRIDPRTGRMARTDLFSTPTGLAAGKDVWVVTQDEQLLRLSPSGEIESNADIRAPGLAPAVGGGSVWVIAYQGRGVIQPFDPPSLGLGPGTETGAFPLDIAYGTGSMWSVDVRGTVLRIDPATANAVARVRTAPTLRSSIAVGGGAVWVAMQGT